MKETPIAEVLRRIRPLSRQHKIFHLRGLITSAKPRSFRKAELEAALKPLINQQLRKESRVA